ncbi:hypothetical protein GC102_31420 [Paenibacillus sp. LMG 31460]|uniref:TniQ protein n=1 Tax=Paenibacillus germinis TaxID=2654979 RepID=A0ABX1ZA68_9BACL|nr:hypothetical protein [Paenibacillus germinis]NOU90221.1 hypothetical protein [Paenibacillus germinis]
MRLIIFLCLTLLLSSCSENKNNTLEDPDEVIKAYTTAITNQDYKSLVSLYGGSYDWISGFTNEIQFRELPHTWFAKHVRWCIDCLNTGFHSWFHQFILVSKCPYHGTKLIAACPNCKEEIPFLLSNKRLSSPFTCVCGYILADFSIKLWSEWDKKFDITDPSVLRWISRKGGDEVNIWWLFMPQHGSIELLTESNLTSSFLSVQSIKRDGMQQTPILIEQIYFDNKSTFKSVDRHLRKTLLQKHSHCINQLWEMRLGDRGEFPKICPYAYAYVFWRKSLLENEYFYRRNTRGEEIESPRHFEYTFQIATKLIFEELQYLFKELQRHKAAKELLWILNKVTAQFCMNFFNSRLRIAEEGTRRESAPSWEQIRQIKESSFRKFAFKITSKKNASLLIEYFQQEQVEETIHNFQCPNFSVSRKRKINRMKSFTPMNIAMNVFDNPSEENMQLKLMIDRYVSKLRF